MSSTVVEVSSIRIFSNDGTEEILTQLSIGPMHIKSPCGKFEFDYTAATFPKKTTPCPCGAPGEYLVRYAK